MESIPVTIVFEHLPADVLAQPKSSLPALVSLLILLLFTIGLVRRCRAVISSRQTPGNAGDNPPVDKLGKLGWLIIACVSVALLAYFGYAMSAATTCSLRIRRVDVDDASDTGATEYRVLDVIGGKRIVCTPVDGSGSRDDDSSLPAGGLGRYFVFETDGNDHFVLYEV